MMKELFLKDRFGITGKVRVIVTDSKTGEVKRVGEWSNNLVMNTTGRGIQMLMERLSGSTTYTGIINYGGIGTSATAPATSDTQLTAETARTTTATATISANVLTCKFFFADANLANGTYREFGTFVDGTSSANSGRLFNHALFGTAHTKATGEDTTVQVDFTFS